MKTYKTETPENSALDLRITQKLVFSITARFMVCNIENCH